jgi:hypothetical protein
MEHLLLLAVVLVCSKTTCLASSEDRQGAVGVVQSSGTNQRSGTQSVLHTSSTSTKSTSSEGISYTPRDGSTCSLPPRVSASLEPGETVSSTSDLNDPILEHFASQRLPAAPAALPIGQVTPAGSPSSSIDGTGSDETGSGTTELNLEQDWALGTPATSDANEDAGTDFGLDQDDDDLATGRVNRDSLLIGLEVPSE